MPNTVQRGNYYVKRTMDWFKAEGWTVDRCEQNQRIVVPGKAGGLRVIFKKRDLWGADLVARSTEQLVFIQVKSSKGQLAEGVKQLSQGPWPPSVGRWVVWWPLRRTLAQGPEIAAVELMEGANNEG